MGELAGRRGFGKQIQRLDGVGGAQLCPYVRVRGAGGLQGVWLKKVRVKTISPLTGRPSN